MMKRSLPDLIPVYGIFNVGIKHCRDFKESAIQFENGEITQKKWEREHIKDLVYQCLIGAYNIGLGLIIAGGVEYFN